MAVEIDNICLRDFMLFVEFCEIKGPNIRGIIPPDLNIPGFDLDKFRTRIVSIDLIGDPSTDSFPEDTWAIIPVPEINAVSLIYLFIVRDFYARACIRTLLFCYTSFSRIKLMRIRESLCKCFKTIASLLQENAQMPYVHILSMWQTKFKYTLRALDGLGEILIEWLRDSERRFNVKTGIKLDGCNSIFDKSNPLNKFTLWQKEYDKQREDLTDAMRLLLHVADGPDTEENKAPHPILDSPTFMPFVIKYYEAHPDKIPDESDINSLWFNKRRELNPNLASMIRNLGANDKCTPTEKDIELVEIEAITEDNIRMELYYRFLNKVLPCLKTLYRLYGRLEESRNKVKILSDAEVNNLLKVRQGLKLPKKELLNPKYYKKNISIDESCVLPLIYSSPPKGKNINSGQCIEAEISIPAQAEKKCDIIVNVPQWIETKSTNLVDIRELLSVDYVDLVNKGMDIAPYVDAIYENKYNLLNNGEGNKLMQNVRDTPYIRCCRMLSSMRDFYSGDGYNLLNAHSLGFGVNLGLAVNNSSSSANMNVVISEYSNKYLCFGGIPTITIGNSPIANAALNNESNSILVQSSNISEDDSYTVPKLPLRYLPSLPSILRERDKFVYGYLKETGYGRMAHASDNKADKKAVLASVLTTLPTPIRVSYKPLRTLRSGGCNQQKISKTIEAIKHKLTSIMLRRKQLKLQYEEEDEDPLQPPKEIEKVSLTQKDVLEINDAVSQITALTSSIGVNTKLLQKLAVLLLSGGTLVITNNCDCNIIDGSEELVQKAFTSCLKGILCTLSMFCCNVIYDRGAPSTINIHDKSGMPFDSKYSSNGSIPPCPWIETDSLATVSALLFNSTIPQIIVCTENVGKNKIRSVGESKARESQRSKVPLPSLPFSTDSRQIIYYLGVNIYGAMVLEDEDPLSWEISKDIPGIIYMRLVGPTCEYKGLATVAKNILDGTIMNNALFTGSTAKQNMTPKNTKGQTPIVPVVDSSAGTSNFVSSILALTPFLQFPSASSLCLHIHNELCRLSSLCVCSLGTVLGKYYNNALDSHIALNIWKTSVSQPETTNVRTALYSGRRIRYGRWETKTQNNEYLTSSSVAPTKVAQLLNAMDNAVADGLIVLMEPSIEEFVTTFSEWV